MIAAPVPSAPLALPVIVAGARAAVGATLKAAGTGKFTVTHCRRTSPHYGACHFSMTFTSAQSGRTFSCNGRVNIRNIGQGVEKSYGAFFCDGKRVN